MIPKAILRGNILPYEVNRKAGYYAKAESSVLSTQRRCGGLKIDLHGVNAISLQKILCANSGVE